jgi:hypothetical protein
MSLEELTPNTPEKTEKTEKEVVRETCEKRFAEICGRIEKAVSEVPAGLNAGSMEGFREKYEDRISTFLQTDFATGLEAEDEGYAIMREIRRPFAQTRASLPASEMDKLDVIELAISTDVIDPYIQASKTI